MNTGQILLILLYILFALFLIQSKTYKDRKVLLNGHILKTGEKSVLIKFDIFNNFYTENHKHKIASIKKLDILSCYTKKSGEDLIFIKLGTALKKGLL